MAQALGAPAITSRLVLQGGGIILGALVLHDLLASYFVKRLLAFLLIPFLLGDSVTSAIADVMGQGMRQGMSPSCLELCQREALSGAALWWVHSTNPALAATTKLAASVSGPASDSSHWGIYETLAVWAVVGGITAGILLSRGSPIIWFWPNRETNNALLNQLLARGVSKKEIANALWQADSYEQAAKTFQERNWMDIPEGYFLRARNRRFFARTLLKLWLSVYAETDRPYHLERTREGNQLGLPGDPQFPIILHGVQHGLVFGADTEAADRLNRRVDSERHMLLVESENLLDDYALSHGVDMLTGTDFDPWGIAAPGSAAKINWVYYAALLVGLPWIVQMFFYELVRRLIGFNVERIFQKAKNGLARSLPALELAYPTFIHGQPVRAPGAYILRHYRSAVQALHARIVRDVWKEWSTDFRDAWNPVREFLARPNRPRIVPELADLFETPLLTHWLKPLSSLVKDQATRGRAYPHETHAWIGGGHLAENAFFLVRPEVFRRFLQGMRNGTTLPGPEGIQYPLEPRWRRFLGRGSA